MKNTDNLNIAHVKTLMSPKELKDQLPINDESSETVYKSREVLRKILRREDKRVIGIIGPCSIHDLEASLDYARRLRELGKKVSDKIYILMRTYFEKPRTTIGWKGLIPDPFLNGSDDIETGLRYARKLLLDITAMGQPCGSELLDPIVPQYTADLISWASIGARTTESQTHREMASGLSMPVGFKNGTSGDLEVAINAMQSALSPHSFIGIDQMGRTSILETKGNNAAHIIFRGGNSSPNYYEENVEAAENALKALNILPAIIIDCSHANSGKKYDRQNRVLKSIIEQHQGGRESIRGFMIESNIIAGAQKLTNDPGSLVYGQSITDACVGWEETEEMMMQTYAEL
ncbi:MAG: 3-deoxy-7-phosphoheptulonate synthase [Spirochaetales bacterium]|nr:3-deoxy-7-phosphoheptulonate synthase [Spirochaetales bacterium]